MKEEFKSAGWKDFQQRFQGTFGWFETANKRPMLVQLTKVSDTRLLFTNKDGMEMIANPDKENVFTFIPVERGVYDTGKTVVYVERIPNRQWKRGICDENSKIIDLETNDQLRCSFELLESIFSKPSSRGVVFNNIVAFIGDTVYLYNRVIGTKDKKAITLSDNLFEQEVSDIVRDHKLNLEVRVKWLVNCMGIVPCRVCIQARHG